MKKKKQKHLAEFLRAWILHLHTVILLNFGI